MSDQPATIQQLITQLAWQVEMGVDEAFLGAEALAMPKVKLDKYLPSSGAATPVEVAASAAIATISDVSTPPSASVMSAPKTATLSGTMSPPMASPDAPDLAAIGSLAELKAGLLAFEGCALKHTASNLVFADGNPGARLMIIGEAPGRDEDMVGLPFVGVSGQLLDKMLASIGLDRSHVYIANLLPWRPPGNRTPTAEETAMMLPWLRRHVQLANPDYVLILGGSAAKAVLDTKDGILKLRGRWQDVDFGDTIMRPTLASLHPAYLLRSPAQKRLSFADILAVNSRLSSSSLSPSPSD
ncbi:uracil-DNA glycosylase [Candidatus Puniceispirillum sp.]|uniref:uracil-DNA glycosylase n=1 Tax=Candidatus Puniceispirillum sp. TaxID=2026719 RepID=UPI003F69B67E